MKPGSPPLVLENSAGAGGNIGGDLAELGAIIRDCGSPRQLGICIDTAHAFAAGHDLTNRSGVDEMLAAIDRAVGFPRLSLIHVNDSKVEAGGRRDRHQNIGEGHIGREGFANLLSIPEINRLPLILETPNLEKRVGEMNLLREAHGGLIAPAA